MDGLLGSGREKGRVSQGLAGRGGPLGPSSPPFLLYSLGFLRPGDPDLSLKPGATSAVTLLGVCVWGVCVPVKLLTPFAFSR